MKTILLLKREDVRNLAQQILQKVGLSEYMRKSLKTSQYPIGSNEMEVHIETARDLKYLNKDFSEDLLTRYQQLGGKLNNLQKNSKTFSSLFSNFKI